MLSELFAALIPQAHAEEKPAEETNNESKAEGGEEAKEEEEPEEPVDPADEIREECSETPECKGAKKHFEHCQEKVQSGQGFKHEDCVEEMFHMMHCVNECAAPKLFAKLK